MAIAAVQDALRLVDNAMKEGDTKYGENAWRDRPVIADPEERVRDHVAAVRRHLDRHQAGEFFDADSGYPALAHVVARALIALQTGINEARVKQEDAT